MTSLLGSLLIVLVPAADASEQGRFERLFWYQPGIEYGNPVSNKRFRVNSPEAVLHQEFGKRSEARSSGMLQILVDESLFDLQGAELRLELWGGHPGTANKRVTPNGRTTYAIPEVGTATENCTHQYPTLPLKLADLVSGHNALQFACDKGSSFWGHFIVEEACIAAWLKPDHPALEKAGLRAFQATVTAEPDAQGEAFVLSLVVPQERLADVASVEFMAFYSGYDENGDGQARDWHGFTKHRQSVGIVGTVERPPLRCVWDVSMLPQQKDMAVRAAVCFKSLPDVRYVTAPLTGLETPQRERTDVGLLAPKELPRPFWSRADKEKTCTIDVDVEPSQIERAELHVVAWRGGSGTVKDYFTLNGRALPVAEGSAHDVAYSRLPIEPGWLRQGENRIAVRSDTEHHGIEILLPGPALTIRYAKPAN